MLNPTLRTALLGSGAAMALMATPAFAGQTEDLKAQIDQLQTRLDQIEKQQPADAKVAAAPADAVVGGDYPGSFKLPGSDTSMSIHGYTKLDFIYDADAFLGDTFDSTGIPGSHTNLQHQDGQFRLIGRQSRINFQTRTPTNYGQLKTYLELDAYGASANTRFNNSFGIRLRHAYGELGPVLGGQTWSNFNNLDDQAETLDFGGPQGATGVRQGQIRYTQALGKFTLSGSVENSNGGAQAFQTTAATTGSTTTAAFGGNTNAVSRMPDFTAHAEYTDSWGDVNVAGVLRRLETDNGGASSNTVGSTVSQSSSTMAGGGVLSGSLKVGNWIGGYFAKDTIAASANYGKGNNRYFMTGTGPNQDAAATGIGSTSVSLKDITEYGGFAWYQHFWTDQLRSTVVYGIQAFDFPGSVPVDTNSSAGNNGAQISQVQTIHGNLIWSPVKSVNIGLEFMYGNIDYRKLPAGSGIRPGGDNGSAKRVMASLQYLF